MIMIQIAKSFAAAGAILLLAACDVKDPIYNTPHPDHAMVTLTTDWSAIGEGVTMPDSYKVQTGIGSDDPSTHYEATLTGVTNKLDHLFNPGHYRFYVYNTPENVHVGGEWADVHTAPGPADFRGDGMFIHGDIGFLFTSIREITLEKDREYELTAPMEQQVRELTFIIEPTKPNPDQINSIYGVFFGAAQACNYETDKYESACNVYMDFEKITTGADAGKWSATVRLLGIVADSKQTLWLGATASNGFHGFSDLPIDISDKLTSFNSDKRKPFQCRMNNVVIQY